MKIEYRVRPVTRYVVTRHYESECGRTGGTDAKGEFDNQDVAYEIGYALCKDEHERLGYAPGDERVKYPQKLPCGQAIGGYALNVLGNSNYSRANP